MAPRLLALAARALVRTSTTQLRSITTETLAERARLAVLDPQRNAVIEALTTSNRPLLGLFNDIPRHKLRESDARAWALAGFEFVVNDGEHSGSDLLYGREENALLQRYGLTPIQRLPREAISAHGDSLACGARGTMRPYALTLDDARIYVEAMDFPVGEGPRRHARGAYPVRAGDGAMTFTPQSLREAEADRTLACLQFETEEYLFDDDLRRSVLEILSKRGNACAFVGALDAATRCGSAESVANGVAELCSEAVEAGVAVGGVVGGDSDNVLRHMRMGMRLVAPPVFASDFALHGAVDAAAPFHAAVKSYNSS
jgi:2-keto-3-deoxy-L-rhamnonate aldolase RhmA